MFDFHEKPNVALEGQKRSSVRTRRDCKELNVQSQFEDKGSCS